MKRTWWYIAGGVVLAALLVVGTLLASPKRPGDTAARDGKVSEATGGGEAPAGGEQPSETDDGPKPVIPSPTKPKPVDPSGEETDGAAPTAPVADKAKLPEVDTAPERTLAMIEPKAASAGEYDIEFRPYGTGPVQASATTLVVRIESAMPRASVKKPFKLTSRNALVNVGPGASGVVKAGGEYRGVLELRPNDGLLVLWLTDASAR